MMKQTDIYVIVQCGYEGIEKLVCATLTPEDAKNKIDIARSEVLQAHQHKKEIGEKFGTEMDSEYSTYYERMYYNGEISHEEFDNTWIDPDAFCVMKWDGVEFKCICNELDCKPSKQWLM